MSYTKRSAAEASRLLSDYDSLNSDLPRDVRHQLAVFVLAPRVGVEALEELFDRPFGQTLHRHRSWMWYTAITTSGCGSAWPGFVGAYNDGTCLHHCLRWLRCEVGTEGWATISRRLATSLTKGRDSLNPYWWRHEPHKPRTKYWTKGGTWDRRSNFTKIIVLGEHLADRRPEHYSSVTSKLTRTELHTVERELHNLFNPDEYLAPHAITGATEYVRTRIPTILGYKWPTCSYATASWFFQTPVPHKRGGWVDWRCEAPYPRARNSNDQHVILDWLPKK